MSPNRYSTPQMVGQPHRQMPSETSQNPDHNRPPSDDQSQPNCFGSGNSKTPWAPLLRRPSRWGLWPSHTGPPERLHPLPSWPSHSHNSSPPRRIWHQGHGPRMHPENQAP